jgi:hypothetical protein
VADTDIAAENPSGAIESGNRRWWAPLWEFCVHVTVGTSMFILIALPAVGLNLLVTLLPQIGASKVIVLGMTSCEYLLFGADIVLFAIFIFRQACKGARNLW